MPSQNKGVGISKFFLLFFTLFFYISCLKGTIIILRRKTFEQLPFSGTFLKSFSHATIQLQPGGGKLIERLHISNKWRGVIFEMYFACLLAIDKLVHGYTSVNGLMKALLRPKYKLKSTQLECSEEVYFVLLQYYMLLYFTLLQSTKTMCNICLQHSLKYMLGKQIRRLVSNSLMFPTHFHMVSDRTIRPNTLENSNFQIRIPQFQIHNIGHIYYLKKLT